MNPFKKFAEEYTTRLLIEINAIYIRRKGDSPFEYASGKKGPIYINARKVVSHPIDKIILGGFMANIIKYEIEEKIECVFGGESGGMSFGDKLAELMNLPFFYVRRKPKKYGMKNSIVGDPKELIRCNEGILIEDSITDGNSKLNFLDEIRKKVKCRNCIVVMDREQGGRQALMDMNCELYSLTTMSKILKTMTNLCIIDEDTLLYVTNYLQDPEGWTKENE